MTHQRGSTRVQVVALAAFVIWSAAGGTAAAQTGNQHAFLRTAVTLTFQPAETSNHRVSPPLGGHSLGISVGVGRFVTPTVAIEGEFVFAGTVSAPQTFSYSWNEEYVAEFRALLLNGLVRWKPRGTSPLEIVAGGGLAATRHATRDGTYSSYFPPTSHPLPNQIVAHRGANLVGGVDIVVPAGAGVSVVNSFRARWRRRNGSDEYYGSGRFAADLGVGIRVGF